MVGSVVAQDYATVETAPAFMFIRTTTTGSVTTGSANAGPNVAGNFFKVRAAVAAAFTSMQSRFQNEKKERDYEPQQTH